ncbi:MAG TPA: NfeD family protein [Candidatus Brocadiia bacterium]|nr:NfeD family protein [Candidatus Brocadiia bacterium]
MENPSVIVIIFVMGMIAMMVEMLIPGLILGTCGLIAVIGAIVLAYRSEIAPEWLGHVLLGVSVLSIPLFFAIWRTLAPKIMGHNDSEADFKPSSKDKVSMLGMEGVTLSILVPGGIADFDGNRVDVVTQGEMIEKGIRVRVIDVSGNRVMVEEVKGLAKQA